MTENQRPWCRCHNIKTLHYFFQEVYANIRKGTKRKQLMTACHECGTPGIRPIKKTPEMQKDWLDTLPIISHTKYVDYRHSQHKGPRLYTLGAQLNKKTKTLSETLNRLKKDRRTQYGVWHLYKYKYEPNPFFGTPFEERWKSIKYGFLRFPADSIDTKQLCEIALRRAEHAKNPINLEPICEHPDKGQSFYPTQFFQRRDIDTKNIEYLLCIGYNKDYLIKVELDLDHIINPETQKMLSTIPEWEGQETFYTPKEQTREIS